MIDATSKSMTRNPRRMGRPSELPSTSTASNTDADFAADAAGAGPVSTPEQAPRVTKGHVVLDLLRREEGALLADIVEATGWQPHTSRAALTGLKKKGHTIMSTKVDKVTRYKLA